MYFISLNRLRKISKQIAALQAELQRLITREEDSLFQLACILYTSGWRVTSHHWTDSLAGESGQQKYLGFFDNDCTREMVGWDVGKIKRVIPQILQHLPQLQEYDEESISKIMLYLSDLTFEGLHPKEEHARAAV